MQKKISFRARSMDLVRIWQWEAKGDLEPVPGASPRVHIGVLSLRGHFAAAVVIPHRRGAEGASMPHPAWTSFSVTLPGSRPTVSGIAQRSEGPRRAAPHRSARVRVADRAGMDGRLFSRCQGRHGSPIRRGVSSPSPMAPTAARVHGAAVIQAERAVWNQDWGDRRRVRRQIPAYWAGTDHRVDARFRAHLRGSRRVRGGVGIQDSAAADQAMRRFSSSSICRWS